MDPTAGTTGQEADRRIVRLVGVYDADGTLRGELTYWVGARLGRTHCSLCEVTHGLVKERADWIACRAGLAVPFGTHHRDDQPDAVRVAAGGVVPIVAAVVTVGSEMVGSDMVGSGEPGSDDAVVVLLGPAEIEACAGSGERLVEAIEQAATDAGLGWSTI